MREIMSKIIRVRCLEMGKSRWGPVYFLLPNSVNLFEIKDMKMALGRHCWLLTHNHFPPYPKQRNQEV